MNIAIITARGGSKRIPHKNIKEFCGKPIIEYSIEAAKQAGIFDTVMVSTDDNKIAEIAKNAGAEVPFMRSEETSNDYATTADVLMEVLEKYKERGIRYENACCIYPTAPFVTGYKLRQAMEMLVKEKKDSVMPIVPFSFPPLRGMVINDGKLEYKWQEYAMKRSQDLEEIYHDCGQFYVFRVETFEKEKKLVTDNTVGMIISELEVQDIDNETDWQLAEMKYRLLKEKGRL
ncbi:MAG: pseudaminic acid cytidylyltransferase [Roseburia sp.]|nr:pseudaminic acid cytidylyltransferase [Roseburia sp.]